LGILVKITGFLLNLIQSEVFQDQNWEPILVENLFKATYSCFTYMKGFPAPIKSLQKEPIQLFRTRMFFSVTILVFLDLDPGAIKMLISRNFIGNIYC
jgi:hypothetical protein